MSRKAFRRGCSMVVTGMILVSATTCSSPEGRVDAGSKLESGPVTAQATMRLPGTSLEDWVSYGDAVVIATATSERELPPSPDDEALGEGLIGREVGLSVDRVLWSRAGAPPPPPTLTLLAPGWVFDGTDRSEMELSGVDRMAPGRRYLIPIVRYPDTGWGPLATVTPLDSSDRIVAGASVADADLAVPTLDGDDTPSVRALPALRGRSPDAIAAVLADTPPDPTAAAYFHLDPMARWDAVGAELSGAAAEPGATTTSGS